MNISLDCYFISQISTIKLRYLFIWPLTGSANRLKPYPWHSQSQNLNGLSILRAILRIELPNSELKNGIFCEKVTTCRFLRHDHRSISVIIGRIINEVSSSSTSQKWSPECESLQIISEHLFQQPHFVEFPCHTCPPEAKQGREISHEYHFIANLISAWKLRLQ